jgi:DNA-directed RNA polymerase subunit beta
LKKRLWLVDFATGGLSYDEGSLMVSHVSTLDSRKRVRRTFGQLEEVTPMPNLIDVQRSSYDTFLQMDVAAHERADLGLQETFKSVFPIEDFAGRSILEFVSYDLETPKYDVEECQQRGLTFASPLRVTLRLVVWEENEDTGSRSIRDIKE